MNNPTETEKEMSLIEELGLKHGYTEIAQKKGTTVYAHTIYFEIDDIDYEDFITEDDTPVDSLFSEKQQRLSIDPLQNSVIDWTDRDFMACANVGVYYDPKVKYPIVPDMFLVMDVKQPDNFKEKKNKCYYSWRYGKVPDLVLEIVSNKVGGEDTDKMDLYARIGVKYYLIHDPHHYLSKESLRLYVLDHKRNYEKYEEELMYMPEVQLGIQLWNGIFEDMDAKWHRWCNKDGKILMTGRERADFEFQRAEQEAQRAEQEAQRAEQEAQRAEQEAQRAEQEAQRAEQEAQAKELALEEVNKLNEENLKLLQKMEEMKKQLAELGLNLLE